MTVVVMVVLMTNMKITIKYNDDDEDEIDYFFMVVM